MRAQPIDDWPASRAAFDRSRRSLAGGVSTGLRAAMQPFPLCFDHASGARMWDVDQNVYTDYMLGWGPLLLGHSHPEVVAAVAAQLPRGQTFGAGHRLEHESAEQVLAALGWPQRLVWSNTGTEAVQVALRLARAATGRSRTVKFAGHYHGWLDNVLVSYRGPQALQRPAPGSGTAGQSSTATGDTLVARWNDLDSVAELLADHSVAAVICEPVVANTGVLEAAPGFLAGLRELCDRTGTVLVFDEVITGLRLALGGAVEHYGVQPDLAVLAKAVASGFSLSAVVGRADLVDQVTAGVVHAGTYNGNPIALAAARATVQVLVRDTPYAGLWSRAGGLAAAAAGSMAAHGVLGNAHAVGPIVQLALGVARVDSAEAYLAADWAAYDRLSLALARRGVLVLPGGRWYLSTAHDDELVAESLAALDDALDELVGAGQVPTC